MSRRKEKKAKEGKVKEKKSLLVIVLTILLIISLVGSIFTIYELFLLSSIENLLRYIAMGTLIFIDLILIIKLLLIKKHRNNPKKKKKKRIGFIIFMILYSAICFTVGGIINYLYGQLDNINKVYVSYSSSLLTMANDKANNINDIKDYEIAIINDKESPDGYIIPQEIIKEYSLNDSNLLIEYDDYSSMLVDLYAGEIDAIFISSSYTEMFVEIAGYEDIATDTKVIISKDKEMKKAANSKMELASTNKSITEPFTILLMGIDSTDEVLSKNAVANGDTLILITFNPKTLNATMVSIPRDSYLPIACWPRKDENKITHAAGYGNDCMINTIQDYFGVKIDYYAKINFKGLVKLVDAVGGVEVNVPQQLCTDDSSRGGVICINPGYQTLNGEQALVFARNRKSLVNGDFGRAQHQQEIIMALVNKMKTITKVSQFTQILDTISNSLDTNLTTKQILEFYNVGKDIIKRSLSSEKADLINIQQLYLSGSSQMIYDERMRMVLYNYVPNTSSKKDIVQAMKENLELAEHENIKSFSFSINVPYEKTIIGKGPYRSGFGTYKLLPDFTGLSKADATYKASNLGISITFEGASGYVVSQSYPANKRLDKINGPVKLTLSVSSEKENDKKTDKDKTDKDKDKVNKDDDEKETNKDDDTSLDTEGKNDDSSSDTGSNEDDTTTPTDPDDTTTPSVDEEA